MPSPQRSHKDIEDIQQEILTEFEGYSVYDLLAVAQDIQDRKKAVQYLIAVSKYAAHCHLDTSAFWSMYGLIISDVYWRARLSRPRAEPESYWHKRFIGNLDTLIPGAKLVSRNICGAGVGFPDFVVQVEGDICPVEIKKSDFTIKAVDQLRRYIFRMGASYGFAVAMDLSSILDNNMIFVSLKHLTE